MLRTSVALFANWAAQLAYYLITHDSTPWPFLLPLDALTASVVLIRPAGRMQGVIGVTLLVQVAMHGAYGLFVLRHGEIYAAQLRYWEILTWIAAAQVVFVGGWLGGGLVRRCHHWVLRRHHQDPASADLAGVGRR